MIPYLNESERVIKCIEIQIRSFPKKAKKIFCIFAYIKNMKLKHK